MLGMPLISCEILTVAELIAPLFFVSGPPHSDLIVTGEGGAETLQKKTFGAHNTAPGLYKPEYNCFPDCKMMCKDNVCAFAYKQATTPRQTAVI